MCATKTILKWYDYGHKRKKGQKKERMKEKKAAATK